MCFVNARRCLVVGKIASPHSWAQRTNRVTLNDPSTRLVIARDYGTSVWPIRRIGFASSRTIFSLSFHELNRERRCNAAILRRFESRERSSSSWKVSTLFLRFPRPPTLSRPVLFFVSFHPSLRVRVRGSLLYPATNARALAIIRRKRARANLALLLRRHRANATRNETKEEEKKRKRERGKRKEREREREGDVPRKINSRVRERSVERGWYSQPNPAGRLW